MGKGVGYGKIILFGEHFVVHGSPAIAAGIPNAVIVEVEKSGQNEVISDKNIMKELTFESIENIRKSMGVKNRYKVFHSGDLPTYGGLGSSAGFCVALVRAIAEEEGMALDDSEVNRHAYEGEKAFHGNPSGIDNTMATYGGMIYFKRGKTPAENVFDRIKPGRRLDLVVAATGIFGNTGKMVAHVRELHDSDPGQFAQIYDEAVEIVNVGRHSLERGKLFTVGALMNSNQRLLEEVGVSDEKNDRINEISLRAGALGAKITGGGGGGCCIALAKDEKDAKHIISALMKGGFESFHTSVG